MSVPVPPQSSSADSSADHGARGLFEPTPWSAVLAAGNSDHPSRRTALETLCTVYWPPLHAYIRRKVNDPHLAQDLTQSFFHRLLAGRTLQFVDPARGRFRTFLIQAFEWHLANEFREARTLRRGGQSRMTALDFAAVENQLPQDSSQTAEQIFERQWALTLLQLTLERLRQEQQSDDRRLRQFDVLKGFLTGQEREGGYAVACRQLDITESAARMAVSRLRSRYREIIRSEILRTVSSSQDVDDEIRQLFRALSAR
jgi:DNA-directed RNA polymerase specialized sigma24 family protein